MYASDSIELLQNCGIQFQKHETDGIDAITFSELLITSGLVLNDNVKWISFHRYSFKACFIFVNPYLFMSEH